MEWRKSETDKVEVDWPIAKGVKTLCHRSYPLETHFSCVRFMEYSRRVERSGSPTHTSCSGNQMNTTINSHESAPFIYCERFEHTIEQSENLPVSHLLRMRLSWISVWRYKSSLISNSAHNSQNRSKESAKRQPKRKQKTRGQRSNLLCRIENSFRFSSFKSARFSRRCTHCRYSFYRHITMNINVCVLFWIQAAHWMQLTRKGKLGVCLRYWTEFKSLLHTFHGGNFINYATQCNVVYLTKDLQTILCCYGIFAQKRYSVQFVHHHGIRYTL